jgi:NADH dehydrogenase
VVTPVSTPPGSWKAWAAGDDAAVPDLASPVPGARTVPNAQHAYRQGKLQHRRDAFVSGGDRPEWNEEELPAPFKV